VKLAISALRSIHGSLIGRKGESRRDSGGPIKESNRFPELQCISGFAVSRVCRTHVFTRRPDRAIKSGGVNGGNGSRPDSMSLRMSPWM